MAIPIRDIPVLKGRIAKEFEKKIYSSTNQKCSVDFSRQIISTKNILLKAKLK